MEDIGTKCTNCGDEIEYAANAIGVQDGVIGGTGFVATHLDDWMLFCSKKCHLEYFTEDYEDRETYQSSRPRIP